MEQYNQTRRIKRPYTHLGLSLSCIVLYDIWAEATEKKKRFGFWFLVVEARSNWEIGFDFMSCAKEFKCKDPFASQSVLIS